MGREVLTQLAGIYREARLVLMSNSFRESSLNLDDTHSFILRISVNRAHGQGGKAYPRFLLEHVNENTCRHFKSLEDVYEELTSQVETVLAGFSDTDWK